MNVVMDKVKMDNQKEYYLPLTKKEKDFMLELIRQQSASTFYQQLQHKLRVLQPRYMGWIGSGQLMSDQRLYACVVMNDDDFENKEIPDDRTFNLIGNHVSEKIQTTDATFGEAFEEACDIYNVRLLDEEEGQWNQ